MAKAVTEVLEFAAQTDVGIVRPENEDSLFIAPDLGLAIVADGMGGANAGQVASGMATTLLAERLKTGFAGRAPERRGEAAAGSRTAALLREAIPAVNEAIFRAAECEPDYSGMGTTLVVAVFHGPRVIVAHVGDSRLYRFRGGSLTQLTRDHSFVQLQVDAGRMTAEEARLSKHRNILTRALGVEARVEPEIHEHDVRAGDLFLLCSDGLHSMVSDADIAGLLRQPGTILADRAQQLLDRANASGGTDNIAVVLVRAPDGYRRPRAWWRRLLVRCGRLLGRGLSSWNGSTGYRSIRSRALSEARR